MPRETDLPRIIRGRSKRRSLSGITESAVPLDGFHQLRGSPCLFQSLLLLLVFFMFSYGNALFCRVFSFSDYPSFAGRDEETVV